MTWDPYLDHLFDEAKLTVASTDTGRWSGKAAPIVILKGRTVSGPFVIPDIPFKPVRVRSLTLEDAAREALRSLMWAQRRANRLAPGYEHIFDETIEDLNDVLTALALKPINLELDNATSSNT